jgi:hypothetical protein
MKYNLRFSYQTRTNNLTKIYKIHIDVYNKMNLTYFSSWILPIKFLFLPFYRIATHLIIPAYPVDVVNHCPIVCGDHDHCFKYTNNDRHFCQCDSGWSGVNCTIRNNECDCSSDSLCLGVLNKRSICLCPLNKIGPRCFLRSICQENPCKNGGYCVPEDDRISMNNFTCVCPESHSGKTCEITTSRIGLSFHKIKIPRTLLIHLITVQVNDHPIITRLWKKIDFDLDITTLYTLIPFNLIIIQIHADFYLSFLSINVIQQNQTIEMNPSQYCSPISQLFDQRTTVLPLIRRVKYYHIPCQQLSQLNCFHDNEEFICLCNSDRHANCFPFDFVTSTCEKRTECENEGQCAQDRSMCPTETMCICRDLHN